MCPNINGVICKQASQDFVNPAAGDTAYNTIAKVIALLAAADIEAVVWQKTVPAQQVIMFGWGSPVLPENQGYLYWALLIATTSFSVGTLRLASNNANNTTPKFHGTMDDTRLHLPDVTSIVTATPTDRRTMQPLPLDVSSARGQDSKIQILYTLSAAHTPTSGGFSIPITRYYL
jgi:hypothetical protein